LVRVLMRRLLLMVVYYYEDKGVKTERVPKKVYMIINSEKVYIDPEIVKKYDLDKKKVSPFTGLKLYKEEGCCFTNLGLSCESSHSFLSTVYKV